MAIDWGELKEKIVQRYCTKLPGSQAPIWEICIMILLQTALLPGTKIFNWLAPKWEKIFKLPSSLAPRLENLQWKLVANIRSILEHTPNYLAELANEACIKLSNVVQIKDLYWGIHQYSRKTSNRACNQLHWGFATEYCIKLPNIVQGLQLTVLRACIWLRWELATDCTKDLQPITLRACNQLHQRLATNCTKGLQPTAPKTYNRLY